MASTTFVDNTTVIQADWCNDVNSSVYNILGNGTTVPANAAAARTNLGLGTMATQAANGVAITGGSISGVTGVVPTGAVTTSGLTMATSRLLGRSTASTGTIEEISVGGGLTLSAGTLTATASVQILPISASVAANALTITASALTLDFRSTTLGSGTVTQVTGTPSSLVVPSGASLGTTSAVQSDLYVLALNNAGTIELAVSNSTGNVDLSETGVISTTAISAGATSATVVYSTTARTNVAYRVIGLIRSTQATAGTWATSPSLVQGAGGNALAATMSLGYGQTWQSVTRVAGTTYYNTTGKPIVLSVNYTHNSGTLQITVSGSVVATSGGSSGTPAHNIQTIIPVGASYLITNTGTETINSVFELR